jgi:hypothetical protein
MIRKVGGNHNVSKEVSILWEMDVWDVDYKDSIIHSNNFLCETRIKDLTTQTIFQTNDYIELQFLKLTII